MNQQESYILQVIEIVSSRDPIVVAGLVFDTIKIEDKLMLHNSSIPLVVKEIWFYGVTVGEIDRGLTAKITLEANYEISFNESRYLYLYKFESV